MYGSRQTHVEISPNVRKSAKLKGERQVGVWRFPPMYGSKLGPRESGIGPKCVLLDFIITLH